MPTPVYLVPLTMTDAVGMECMLASAAREFQHDADRCREHGLIGSSERALRDAATCRQLSAAMRTALNHVVLTHREDVA